MWKRCGSGKPQQTAKANSATWLAEPSERPGGSRSQQMLAPYKQEVARSSRAPPILWSSLLPRTAAVAQQTDMARLVLWKRRGFPTHVRPSASRVSPGSGMPSLAGLARALAAQWTQPAR